MSKLILKIVAIILVSLAPIYIMGTFDNISFENDDVARIKASEQFKSLDVLILGNSHSYAGVNTSLFDSAKVKAYNLSSPAAGPYSIQLLLENYIRNTGSIPKNILVNIGPEMFTPNSDVFDQFPIHRYLKPAWKNEELLINRKVTPGGYSKLFIQSGKQGFKKILKRSNTQESKLIQVKLETKGYSARPGVLTDSLYKKHFKTYSVFKEYEFDQRKAEAFLGLIEYCEVNEIHVFVHPIPNNKLPDFLNPDLVKDYELFLQNLQTNGRINVLNYPGVFPLYGFADIDHMNPVGADLYTRFLLHKIVP